jgi:predicted nuclease with RNAse H fold
MEGSEPRGRHWSRGRRGPWVGVDVGGRRKGFHVATADERGVIGHIESWRTVAEVVDRLTSIKPEMVAIDSPISPAAAGERSRACERGVARAICGIRYTPDQSTLDRGTSYYEWIRNGLALYSALEGAPRLEGVRIIEVFPTASWTQWFGRRGSQSRRRWSAAALAEFELDGVIGRRLNQDGRDAIGAALTARDHSYGRTESAFEPIIVPVRLDRVPNTAGAVSRRFRHF